MKNRRVGQWLVWRPADSNPGSDPFSGGTCNASCQFTRVLVLREDAGQRINGINMGAASCAA